MKKILLLCFLSVFIAYSFVSGQDTNNNPINQKFSNYCAGPETHDIPNPNPSSDIIAPDSFFVSFGTNVTLKSENNSDIYFNPIVLEVRREWAPLGVDRFFSLIQDRFYDNAGFFRVVPELEVQFGIASTPAETSKWDTPIPDDPVILSNLPWTVSFAKSEPNTRTTQVFINYINNSRLDSLGFSPFAKVISGQNTLLAIRSPTNNYKDGLNQTAYTLGGNVWLEKFFPNTSIITCGEILSTSPTMSPTVPISKPASLGAVASGFLSFFGIAYASFAILTILLFIKVLRSDTSKQKGYLVVLTLIPTISCFSNIYSALTTEFGTKALVHFTVLFLLSCEIPLVYRLYKLGVTPIVSYQYPGYWYFSASLIWIGSAYSSGHIFRVPTFEGHPLTGMKPSRSWLLLWTYAIAGQSLSILTYFLWLCTQIHIPILLLLGCFLYQNQGIAAAAVWNWWFHLFSGSRNYDSFTRIDVGILNEVRCYLCVAQSLPMLVIQAINLSILSLWDRKDIITYVCSSLLALDLGTTYARYYFWHGYYLNEIPTEVSIFGYWKVDLLQEFVEPPEIHWDFSCDTMCNYLFYGCLDKDARLLMREEAIQRTQDYYDDRIATLTKARNAEKERTERRRTMLADPTILEKRKEELAHEETVLDTLEGKFETQQQQLQRQSILNANEEHKKELEQEKSALKVLQAQLESQRKQLQEQAEQLTAQQKEIEHAKSFNIPKKEVKITVEVIMKQEAEEKRGVHTTLWEDAFTDIDNCLSPLAEDLIYSIRISSSKDLASLSSEKVKKLQDSLIEASEQTIAADLQQLHDFSVKHPTVRMVQCRCEELWKKIVFTLPKWEHAWIQQKPPIKSAFDLVKNLGNKFFVNDLLQNLPTVPKETLTTAIARMRLWNMQWKLFNKHLIAVSNPFTIACKEEVALTAPKIAIEIEMSILNRNKNNSNQVADTKEIENESDTKNPIQDNATSDDIEHQKATQLDFHQNNSNSNNGNSNNLNEMWFSTDDMYQMTFTSFNEEL